VFGLDVCLEIVALVEFLSAVITAACLRETTKKKKNQIPVWLFIRVDACVSREIGSIVENLLALVALELKRVCHIVCAQ